MGRIKYYGDPDWRVPVAALVLLLGAALVIDGCSAKMESDTYNRLTGAQTTWWDAVWVELRVQEGTK